MKKLPLGISTLNNIINEGYADKYRNETDEIYLIGLEFDRRKRNIVRFDWESA